MTATSWPSVLPVALVLALLVPAPTAGKSDPDPATAAPSAVAAQGAPEGTPLPSPGAAIVDATDVAPNADRPLTHDEFLAVRGDFGFDTEVYDTFVAQTTIDRSPPPRGPEIGLRTDPSFGVLSRKGEYPGDPVVTASRSIAARYPADRIAVSGLLAIEATTEGLHLLGTVATPAGTYRTPVEPEAMELAEQLPAGSLILARGWLSRLGQDEDCPPVGEKLPRARGGGSPFAECPAGWLTPAEVTTLRPGDPTRPDQFGIRVQSGARKWIWQRFERGPEVGSTYLLRRVANPIGGAEPELGWEVISILEPVDIPAPAADAGTDAPGGLDWQPALERQPPSDTAHSGYRTGPIETITWRGGLASIHQGRDRVLSVWVSPDGRSWQSAPLPRGIRNVEALLRLGDGLAIIADQSEIDWDIRDWRFEVWRSDDGLDWYQASRQRIETPARFADPADAYFRIIQGYWSVGDEIVAHETYTTHRCCGRSTGTMFVAAGPTSAHVTFAWSSRTGVHWDRERVTGLTAADGWHYTAAIHEIDGELFALAGYPTGVIDHSRDGVSWRSVGKTPNGLDLLEPVAFGVTPDGFVLGGTISEPPDGGRRERVAGVVWHSAGGQRWIETFRPDTGRPRELATLGDFVVMTGAGTKAEDEPGYAPPWIRASADGGLTWPGELAWQAEEEWCFGPLTAGADRFVLDAPCAPPGNATKSLLLPEDPGEATAPDPETTVEPPLVTPLEAVSCDTGRAYGSVRDEWEYLNGFDKPREALSEALSEPFLIPKRDYEVLERSDRQVLFGYRNGEEVKSAVRVASLDGEGGAWIPEALAYCHVAELGDARMGKGVKLWTDRAGWSIHEIRGSEHCWEDVRILYLTDPTQPHSIYSPKTFVRDPNSEFRDRWKSDFHVNVPLPRTARFTGFRRDGSAIWLAADGKSVYVKRGAFFERWPLVRGGIGCA